ncbi:MAG: T9SS type A sorting domain-containing protein [Flavobacteriales bacterium]|nr:T9SS type A sorting domain-containing protein [Flavobacteriales bacterium]
MRRSLLISSFALPVFAFAQTGTNSSCATAIELEVSPTNVQLALLPMHGLWFTDAVPDPVTTCSGNLICLTAWYSFTATATSHWIRTEGADNDGTIIEAFSGSCGALNSIACFPLNTASMALTGLTIGGTYHFRVQMDYSWGCSANDCQIWLGVVSAPVNNECSGAIQLPLITGAVQAWPTTEVSSLGATQSQAACGGNAAASNDDVWFRFTANSAAHAFATRSLFGLQDNVVQWYSGTCGNLTSLVCDQDFATGLVPGTQYYIRTYSESTDPAVSFRMLADVLAPPPNDECVGAFPVEVTMAGEDPKPVSLSTIHATSSTVPCDVQPHDAWISFVAPGTSAFMVTEGQGYVGVFSGGCGALVCHVQGSTNPELELTGLTPGATYYVKVDATTPSRKNMKVWVFAPTTNADCTTAIDLDVQIDPIDYTQGHLYASNQSAWYRFTVTQPRLLIDAFSTAGASHIGCEVFSGACGNQTQVAASNALYTPLVLTGLVVGEQVYVRVNATAQNAFRIAVREPVPNDVCDGAVELPFSTPQDYTSTPPVNNILADDGAGGCLPNKDLWYRFTATHTSAGMVIQQGLGTIEWYSGACGALTSLGCTSNTSKALFTGLTPGTEYLIRVSSSALGMRFTPMLFDQPLNDEVGGAYAAPFGTSFAQPLEQYWTFGASQSMAASCPGSSDDDTWFTFTATAAAHSVMAVQRNNFFDEDALGFYYIIEVYDTVSTDAAVLSANLISCGASPRALTGLTIGKEYLYRAYHSDFGAAGTCGFISGVSTSNNDEANGAMLLAYTDTYSASFGTTGATQSQPGADCQVDDTADDDIWFKFVAAPVIARLAVDADVDVTIELFSGTPGNLTSIACDGNILEVPTLTAGQTYYARVYSWNNATPANGRIGLIATPSLTANGCVDEACLGPVLVPNPGIEQGEHCFIHLAEVDQVEGLGTQLAPGWPRLQGGSSDAFNSCTSVNATLENPGMPVPFLARRLLSRSGKGMGGFIATDMGGLFAYTEYLQAPLSEALVPGEPYLVSFHVATFRGAACVSGLGAALSEGPLATQGSELLNVTTAAISLDVICTEKWTNICGIIVPNAPVDHITIGAFQGKGEASTFGVSGSRAYYFVDDVVVSRVTDPGCITSIGDVPPLDESTSDEGDALRVYPNPANELLNIVADASLFGQRAVIEVFDATGSRVHAEQVNAFGALQPLDLSREWKEGLYVVMVRVEGQAPKAARVVVNR